MANKGQTAVVSLFRGHKDTLEKLDRVFEKYVIVVETPDDYVPGNKDQLLGLKCKYKICDGKHTYKELPYEPEKIPAAFKIPSFSSYMRKIIDEKSIENEMEEVLDGTEATDRDDEEAVTEDKESAESAGETEVQVDIPSEEHEGDNGQIESDSEEV